MYYNDNIWSIFYVSGEYLTRNINTLQLQQLWDDGEWKEYLHKFLFQIKNKGEIR